MGPTPEPEKFSAVLEVTGGKTAIFETVEEISCNGKIVVKPIQKQTSNLTVYKVPNMKEKSVLIAFCFELNQKKYVLGVEEKKICFEIQAQIKPKDFNKKFLFKWARNKSQYGSLSSVAEPGQYLRVHDTEVTLSCKPDHGFKVNFLEYGRSIYSNLTCNSRMKCKRCVCSVEPLKINRTPSKKQKA